MHTIPQSVVNRRQFRRLPLVLALTLAWPLAACVPAFAQQPDGDFDGEHAYKEADGTEVDFVEPKALKSKIPPILRNGKIATAEEEKQFTDFFRYRLAEMTWKENITSLPAKRKDLKNYLGQAGRGAAPDLHVRLNKWILEEFQKIAKDDRYPRAIRLNCVLMIGELDQREGRVQVPAIPLAEAESVLFGFFKDEAQHDVIRIEALWGLLRHANSNLTGDQRSELVGAAIKLLKASEPAKGKSAVGHQWMRMQACDLLSTLADKGAEANQPEVVDAFQTLIADKNSELWLRCHAAGEMGYLQSKAFPQEKVLPISQRLADLVVEVAQTNDRLMAAAGVAAPKKPAAPPKPKADKEREGEAEQAPPPAIPESVLKLAAEDVADELIRIRHGLTGVEAKESTPSADLAIYAAGDADAKAFIKELVGRIDGMLKKLKDAKRELHEQLADVSSDGGELQTWLKQQGVSAGEEPEKKVVAPSGAKPAGKPAPGAAAGRPSGNAGATESTVNP